MTHRFGKPVGVLGRVYGKRELLALGCDCLPHAIRLDIPVALVGGREPPPSMEGSRPGRPVLQPVEVEWLGGEFVLHAGNHRVLQAERNGDAFVPAFVYSADREYDALRKRFL